MVGARVPKLPRHRRRTLFSDAKSAHNRGISPHWPPPLGARFVWLHFLGELTAAAAYIAMPAVIAYCLLRRGNARFPLVFWLFTIVLLISGGVHFVEALNFGEDWIGVPSGLFRVLVAVTAWAAVIVTA